MSEISVHEVWDAVNEMEKASRGCDRGHITTDQYNVIRDVAYDKILRLAAARQPGGVTLETCREAVESNEAPVWMSSESAYGYDCGITASLAALESLPWPTAPGVSHLQVLEAVNQAFESNSYMTFKWGKITHLNIEEGWELVGELYAEIINTLAALPWTTAPGDSTIGTTQGECVNENQDADSDVIASVDIDPGTHSRYHRE